MLSLNVCGCPDELKFTLLLGLGAQPTTRLPQNSRRSAKYNEPQGPLHNGVGCFPRLVPLQQKAGQWGSVDPCIAPADTPSSAQRCWQPRLQAPAEAGTFELAPEGAGSRAFKRQQRRNL